ncbi:MAG TPA: peptidylprolyl isomerase [Verrucomicrobiae bacterium]|nr:peptidylprolyl isomerase [Verrucomicrobiae bacterium]
MKSIFPAAFLIAIMLLPRVHAATANATAPATDTNNPNATMTALFGDPVIAKGKGFELKQSQLDEVLTGLKSAAAARGQTIPPEQLKLYEGLMLNRLIETKILLQQATAEDKAAGQKLADAQIAALLKRAGSQEKLDQQIKALGMSSVDDVRKGFVDQFTAEKVLESALKITVSDDEIKKFYADHPDNFEQPEMVHVRHILLMTIDPTTRQPLSDDQKAAKRKQIDDILKRARAGEDFAKLATLYSEDPGSKDDGGELAPFPHGQMVAEFDSAAFALNTNQISDVVTTQYGYHIIKLLDKTPAKKLELTDTVPAGDTTVSDSIKRYLTQQKVAKLAPPYLSDLKKTAGVEITDADLKAAAATAEANALKAASATNEPAAN